MSQASRPSRHTQLFKLKPLAAIMLSTLAMHAHAPFLLISLDRARARLGLPDGSNAILDLNPGQALWLEGATHSWELLSGQLRVIGVEIKAAAR